MHPKVEADLPRLLHGLRAGEVPAGLKRKIATLVASFQNEREKRFGPSLLAALDAHSRNQYRGLSPDFLFFAAYAIQYVLEDEDFSDDRAPDGMRDDCQVVSAVTAILKPELDCFRLWQARARVQLLWDDYTKNCRQENCHNETIS